MTVPSFEHVVSVSTASKQGISRIVADAENGASVVIERHGKPAAVVVAAKRMELMLEQEENLRLAALVLARAATDDGQRTTLDEAIEAFGYSRAELEAELDSESTAI
ncbi:MAG: type II toxin-antitoxin system Phd/YefM family antitoxin [Acidimicrobiia bacterium]